MTPTKLHPAVQKALRTPSPEECNQIRKIVGAIRDHQATGRAALFFTLLLSVLFFAIGISVSLLPLLAFALLFGCAAIYGLRTLLVYQAVLPSIFSGNYRVAKGTSYYIQQSGRSDFNVYGIIGNGKQANILFNVDMDVIKTMPGDEWDFYVVATDREAIIVIPAPQNRSRLFATPRITSALAMPYCDPKE